MEVILEEVAKEVLEQIGQAVITDVGQALQGMEEAAVEEMKIVGNAIVEGLKHCPATISSTCPEVTCDKCCGLGLGGSKQTNREA